MTKDSEKISSLPRILVLVISKTGTTKARLGNLEWTPNPQCPGYVTCQLVVIDKNTCVMWPYLKVKIGARNWSDGNQMGKLKEFKTVV
jgi:hypothetical protein